MRVLYHPDAEAEIIEAARYYEQQVQGLGGRFLDEIDRAVEEVLAAPNRWPLVEGDLRRILLRKFPYSLLYRPETQAVRILVAWHGSRNPDYWRYRLVE